MGFFPILIIIAVVVISIANAKKKEAQRAAQAAKRAAGQAEQADGQAARTAAQATRTATQASHTGAPAARPVKQYDPRFFDLDEPAPKAAAPAQQSEYRGSMTYSSTEGSSTEGTGKARYNVAAPSVTHVVKPVTESRHSHTESSLTGLTNGCPPEMRAASAVAAEAPVARPVLSFDTGNVVNGIIYAEILGKPKALRR